MNMNVETNRFNAALLKRTGSILQNRIRERESYINDYKQRLSIHRTKKREVTRQLNQLKNKLTGSNTNVLTLIKKLPFVKKVTTKFGTIRIYTKDLKMRYGAKSLNFGEYQFYLTPKSSKLRGKRSKGLVLDCNHPFINKTGDICYGHDELRYQVKEWLSLGRLDLICAVTWDLLKHCYMRSSPYVSIHLIIKAFEEGRDVDGVEPSRHRPRGN